MRDFMTLKVAGNKKLVFNDAAGSDSLYVTVAATHSGTVNGNLRFYRPDLMQASAHTWVKDGRPNKPVLLRHDKDCDPVGRVLKARYVDLSYKYQLPELRNTLFFANKKGRKGLFESVNWVVNNLQNTDDYEGLGYIELGLKITDPVTIRKVQNDEYLTVSVGFSTDHAACSVCHTDWACDDRCEHKLGRVYDGKRCFLVTGNFDYEEVSWVNFPADPFAAVTSKKAAATAVADSLLSRAFYLGLPHKEQDLLVMSDSLEDREFNPLESDIEPVELGDDNMDLNEIVAAAKADSLNKESALVLIAELESFNGADANEKRKATRTLNTLKATVKANGWGETNPAELTQDQVESKISTLAEVVKGMDAAQAEAYIAQLADEAAVFGLDFTPPGAETAEPAADAATETSAETVTDAQIELEGLSAEDNQKLTDSKNGKKILSCVTDLDAMHNALEDEEKYILRSCMTTLMERWNADGYLAYLKTRLESKDETVISKKELDTLTDAVGKYEAELTGRASDNKALLATNKTLVAAQKTNLATVIVALELLAGQTSYQGLDAVQLQAEIERKSKRHLVSLHDAVEDLLERVPTFKQQAAPEQKSTEVAKEIADDAHVDSVEQPDANVTDQTTDEPAESGVGTINFPVVTMGDMRRVHQTQAVAQYRAMKKINSKTE